MNNVRIRLFCHPCDTSTATQNTNNNKTQRLDSYRGSSSTSSSSAFSLSSISVPLGQNQGRSLGKDITLLQDHSVMTRRPAVTHNHHHHHLHNNPNYTLQNLLARPFNKDPQTTVVHGSTHPASIVLSLNSGHGFDFVEPNEHLESHLRLWVLLMDYLVLGRRGSRNLITALAIEGIRRMIKNRESAARSRSRKQECEECAFS